MQTDGYYAQHKTMMCVTGSMPNGTIATTETATPLSQHKPIRVGGCGYFYRSGSQAPQESYSLNAPLTPHAGSRDTEGKGKTHRLPLSPMS